MLNGYDLHRHEKLRHRERYLGRGLYLLKERRSLSSNSRRRRCHMICAECCTSFVPCNMCSPCLILRSWACAGGLGIYIYPFRGPIHWSDVILNYSRTPAGGGGGYRNRAIPSESEGGYRNLAIPSDLYCRSTSRTFSSLIHSENQLVPALYYRRINNAGFATEAALPCHRITDVQETRGSVWAGGSHWGEYPR